MDPSAPIQALWSGPRIGSSRRGTAQQQSKPRSTASAPPPAAAASAAVANPFTPHDLQLRPGDTVTGVALGTSSSSRCYVLDSEVHRGPRSAVWRATDSETQDKVVLKVLGLGSKQQQSAALRELDIMQQLTDRDIQRSSNSGSSNNAEPTPPAAADSSSNDSTDSTSSNRAGSHLVRLLGAFLLQQRKATPAQSVGKTHHNQQQQQQQQQEGPSTDASLVSEAAAGDSSSRSGVVLVMPQLHQSLSWVLHFVHQRNGRLGLPPAAVRSYAHQLLTALAQLHDSHAVVHRDVKPSNMLLQAPFVVRTGKKHMMRSMTLSELTTAQWMLIDLGNAARLQPPAQAGSSVIPSPAAAGGAAPTAGDSHPSQQDSSSRQLEVIKMPHPQQHHQQPQQQQGLLLWFGQAVDSLLGKSTAGPGTSSRVAADTPSGMCWQVAAGDAPGYESVAYVPPEAILHCPATAAYDIWSAACSIFEAATGRTLFPVEAAAAARRSITDRVYRPADNEPDDTSTLLDEVHLALIKGVAGAPPAQVLARSSVADELFFDSSTGGLWLSEEEEEAPELRGWRQRAAKPLLHHLMARRTMSLQQAIDLAELLQPMLAWDPAERPTAAELLQHPYFSRLHEEQGEQQLPAGQQQQQEQK